MQSRENIMRMAFNARPHLKLSPIEGLTSALVCGTGPGYVCELHGPFYDTNRPGRHEHELRVFVAYRKVGNHRSIRYLVQDADDDAFLNSTALGAARYNVGPVVLEPRRLCDG